jgi:hypothetical protein
MSKNDINAGGRQAAWLLMEWVAGLICDMPILLDAVRVEKDTSNEHDLALYQKHRMRGWVDQLRFNQKVALRAARFRCSEVSGFDRRA